jgi:hypothetical protein
LGALVLDCTSHDDPAGKVDGGTGGQPAGCAAGCSIQSGTAWCAAPTAEWVCEGTFDRALMVASGCNVLATDAIRFCCPAGAPSECQ